MWGECKPIKYSKNIFAVDVTDTPVPSMLCMRLNGESKMLILLNMFLSNMRKERDLIVLMFNIFENTWDFYTGLP